MANANNVTWNTPPPAAVGGYPIVVPNAQIAEAVGNAPAALAERNAKTAEADATAQIAPLRVDQMRSQAQAASLKAEDEQLARLAGPIAANPALANAPALRNILAPIFQKRGLQIPMNAQGQVDARALSSILSPQRSFAEWTQDDVNKAMAAPPSQRVLPNDAPDWLKTTPARVPISAAGVENIAKGIDAKEKLLSDAHSGYTPGMFLRDVRSTQARLRAAGMDGDADALGEYLSPDGATLNDAFKERHVGEQYRAEIQKLHMLGLHVANEDAYREEREKDLRSQFDRKETFDYARLASQEKRSYVAAQNQARRIDLESQRVQGYLKNVDNVQARWQQSSTDHNFAIYKGVLQQASSELNNAQKSLDAVTQQINNMSQNGKLRNSPLYTSLVDQAASLKQYIDAQGPVLRARQQDAAGAMLRTFSSITGSAVQSTQPAPSSGYPTLHGRPIRPNAAGDGWVYFDGTPVTN